MDECPLRGRTIWILCPLRYKEGVCYLLSPRRQVACCHTAPPLESFNHEAHGDELATDSLEIGLLNESPRAVEDSGGKGEVESYGEDGGLVVE